jgi:hypothetical protein
LLATGQLLTTPKAPSQLSAEATISQYQNSTDKPPAFGHYKKWSTNALLMGNGDMGLSVGGDLLPAAPRSTARPSPTTSAPGKRIRAFHHNAPESLQSLVERQHIRM